MGARLRRIPKHGFQCAPSGIRAQKRVTPINNVAGTRVRARCSTRPIPGYCEPAGEQERLIPALVPAQPCRGTAS